MSRIASKKLKGITVEIGGDTTGLNDAIQKTIDLTSDVQQELREVNSALKFNPENTELLAQKQELLAKQVENTKNKLNILKEAQEQVEQTFANGDMAEEAYRAFQRELITTQSTLEHFENQLGIASGEIVDFGEDFEKAKSAIDENKQSISEHAGALAEMGQAAAKAVTAVAGAVTAVATYATKFSDDFTQALNHVQASTGATVDEIKQYKALMEEIYADGKGEDLNDIANSLSVVKQNFKDISDSADLKTITENALTLRDTFDFEVSESIRAVKMLMDKFGVSADEAYTLIAQGTQNGLNCQGDLMDIINEYSVHFSQLGYSAEEMLNAMQNGLNTGAFSVDKLGDAMKELGIRSIDLSESTKDAFSSLGLISDSTTAKIEELSDSQNKLSFEDYTAQISAGGESAKKAIKEIMTALAGVSDETERNRIAVELFGTMWEDVGSQGILAMSNLDGSVSTAKNTLEEINNVRYSDIGNQLETLKRSFEIGVIKPIGDEIAPLVSEMIDTIKSRLPDVKQKVIELIEAVKPQLPEIKEMLKTVVSAVKEFGNFIIEHGGVIISVLAGIVAGIMAFHVVSIIQLAIGVFQTLFLVIKSGCTVVQFFNLICSANPYAVIAGIVIGLIAALVTGITLLWNNCEVFRNSITNLWDGIKLMVADIWNWIVEQYNNFVAIIDLLKIIFSGAIQAIRDKIQEFKDTWIGIWDIIKAKAEEFSLKFIEIKDGIVNIFTEKIPSAISAFKDSWIAVWDGVKLMVADIWNWIVEQYNNFVAIIDLLKIIFSGAIQAIRDKIQEFKDTWIVIWDIIKAKAEEFSLKFTEIKDGIVSVFTEKIPSAIVAFKDSWIAVWDGVKQKFEEIWSSFEGIAKAPINSIIGLINGLISGINWLINGLNTVSITIPDWVPEIGGNSFGISLPYVNEIPYLAKGGILEQGSAIVGEAGAELLTIASGKAIVQPLTNNTTNSSIGTTNNYYNSTYEINATISNDYDVTKLAYQLEFNRRQNEMAVGK